MKDFASCFGESGVRVANRVAPPQNVVACVYHYHSHAFSGFITVTWVKNLMAQGFTIGIESSQSLAKVDIKPWLLSKRKGLKTVMLNSIKVDIYWDLSCAKFGYGPEPLEGFYVAVAFNQQVCLLVGDSAHKKEKLDPIPIPVPVPLASELATLVAKKEDIFGKRVYSSSMAQFSGRGSLHDIRIELEYEVKECLSIFIDRKQVLQVTRLNWKFRGNQTILVDGVSVDVYWDVHSWLFGGLPGNAIFLFRSHVASQLTKDEHTHGFSLVLCAWKNE